MKQNHTLTVNAFAMLTSGAVFGILFQNQDYWALIIKLLCIAAVFQTTAQNMRPRRVFAHGWLWGASATLTGMAWLFTAMHDVGGMPAWMASIAMVLFSGLLGIFNGFGTLGTALLSARQPSKSIAAPFIASWVLAEWLRTWVLTGLPWMNVGYGFIDSPAAGLASTLGVLGVGGAVAAGAVCCVMLLNQSKLKALTSLLLIYIACLGLDRLQQTQLVQTTLANTPKPLTVSLLQGNVLQTLKFDPAKSLEYMQRYITLAQQSNAALIVMPETALPTLQENLPTPMVQALKNVNSTVVIGLLGNVNGQYTNRLSTPFANETWLYDKVHLVPFGEAIPNGFQWFVDMMHIPLSSLGRGSNDQPALVVDGIKIAANICYEELFAHEWRKRAGDAHVLLNASNFGWYGDGSAMAQHVNIARMRAMEFQKPYISATNNGMTIAIHADGKVQAQLEKNTQGSLNVTVEGKVGRTFYADYGDWSAVFLAFITLLWAGWRRQRSN